MGCFDSSSTTSANPDAQAAYTDVVGKAQQVASTPYQPYTGELVAGLNQGQNAAISQLRGSYGAAQPYIHQASDYLSQAGAGLGNVQQYLQAGSTATAGAHNYMDAAANQYGQGNTLTLMGSNANQQVGQYLGLAQSAFGQEQAGLGQVGNYLNAANGYFGQAANLATPQDFTGADGVSKYMNPFQQSVIDTTMAQARQNDSAQTASLVGNAIGNGAYGGDRNGIAVATLAGQQAMANNSTVANLNAQNYNQATQQFNTTQAQRQAGAGIYSNLGQGELQAGGLQLNTAQGYGQAGAGYANLGQLQGQVAGQYGSLAANSNAVGAGYNALGQLGLGSAAQYASLGQIQGTAAQAYGTLGGQVGALGAANQSSLISGASAGLQGATLQQQAAQQQDTAAYNQYMAGLSYPYQNVGFLSNIVQGIGSQEGNTQTTQGNALSGVAGLAATGVGIMGATGAFGQNGYLPSLFSGASNAVHFAHGGAVRDDRTPLSLGSDPRFAAILPVDVGTSPVMDTGLGGVGRFAALQGADLAARMSKADGGPVMGLVDFGDAVTPGLGSPIPTASGGFGMAPGVAGMGGLNLGSRPRFDFGGAVDPNAPTTVAGLNVSPAALTGGAGSGLNTSPAALTGGMATAHAAPGLGARPGVLTGAPSASTAAASSAGAGLGSATLAGNAGSSSPGLGAPVSFSSAPQSGRSDISFSDTGSAGGSPTASSGAGSGSGDSRNGWMGLLAAGLGMMGATSGSAAGNIGQGGLKGLQTYLGLEQQDRANAVQQQDFGLRSREADQTAAYHNQSLTLDQKKVDLSTKQLETEIANQQRQAGIQSATLANNTANMASEVAARNQATAQGRYSRVFVPGVGYVVTDLNNPTAPPVTVPLGGASPPSTQASPTPSVAAPPPQGGVSASGAPAAGGAMPGSAPVVPAALTPTPSRPMPPPAGQAAGPQSVSSLVPASVPQGWKPTTAVPQGYVPANSMGIAMSGDGGKAQAEIGQKQVEGLQTNAGKAASAQMQLYQMNAAIDGLPKTGLLAPGAYGDQRAHVANSLNGIAQTFGAQPLFPADQAADTQELAKGAFRLGTSMIADTNGGREAGFILQNSVKNVPSINNSYLGFKRVAAGIDQANQYAIDKANFVSDYYAKFHHVDGADAAFNKLNPWQNYAQRAIDSSTMPSAPPAGVPVGSAYSMSRQQWRAPDGSVYGANGQRAQ